MRTNEELFLARRARFRRLLIWDGHRQRTFFNTVPPSSVFTMALHVPGMGSLAASLRALGWLSGATGVKKNDVSWKLSVSARTKTRAFARPRGILPSKPFSSSLSDPIFLSTINPKFWSEANTEAVMTRQPRM